MSPVPDSIGALLAEFRGSAATDPEGAVHKLSQQLHHAGVPPGVWCELSNELLANGNAAAAERLLRSGLSVHPRDAALLCLLGNTLRVKGRYQEAERRLRAALSIQPDQQNAMWSLAFLLREQGRFAAATEVVLDYWSDKPVDADEVRTAATFIAQCGHSAEALDTCRRALARCEDAKLFALSGVLASTLGLFEQASADLRTAVRLDPELATSWLWLALSHKFMTRDDPDLLAMEGAFAKSAENTRICLGFALGKAYDDLDDIPAAVRVLREANDAMARRIKWSPEKWKEFVAAKTAAPPPAPIAASQMMPIFVVGLPRTGTTLVATLLAKNRGIRNRGEMGWLAQIDEQGAPYGYPRAFLSRASETYAAQLRRDDEPARFYIDKNPSNIFHLGLAAALFPNARVIHCQRNLRDTALSIWRQHFTDAGNGYTYRFRDIAQVAQSHDRLMQHWRAVLSLPIYSLEYETLVSRPNHTIPDLLRFLGVEEAEETPADSAVIGTASLWQARQEVNTRSLGRWRAYAPYLPELLEFPDG